MKLSIVIPTKDRYKYLLPLLELLDGYKLMNTEVIVEDNSKDNFEYVKYMQDHHLEIPVRYYHNPCSLPISKNIDNAINHSRGDYVCVIGDDDAVTPLIEDFVKWMEDNDVDSVRQKKEITYKWPTYKDDEGNYLGAVLSYGIISDKSYIIDTKIAVKNVVERGLMSMRDVPCVYQGIVKRDTLNKLYNIGNTYFPGPSPDMANAVALAFVVNNHHVTDMPIIVSGGSEYQGGRSEKIKTWVQPLENIPFISDAAKSKWDKRIPYYWSGYTVWPESAIKGLEYVGKEKMLQDMDFELLLAKCMYESFESRKHILSRTKKTFRVWLLFVKFYIRENLAKVKRSYMRKLNIAESGTSRMTGIMTIDVAVKFLMSEYGKIIDKKNI